MSGVWAGALPAAKTWTWDSVWTTIADWPWDIPLKLLIIAVSAVIAQVLITRAIRRAVKSMTARARTTNASDLRSLDDTTELSNVMLTQRTEQRAQAMGALLRSAAIVTIWVIAIMTMLTTVGINIGPLLASAGVLGVIIGFGAQQLVADYLAGISMIFEDQLGVGDVVFVGEVTGTVEDVALRYTRIRDFDGTVWYIRNGQMTFVANQSKGWTLARVDFPVPYDADLDQVRDVINAAGKVMGANRAYDGILLDAPVFAGVEVVRGDAIIIRIHAKTAPEKQFSATRAIREQMKIALDTAGIQVPVQTVRFADSPNQDPNAAGPRA
ncbi:MAG: mechanosensitive ion channel family protein [Candidatus Nanopelagicales bacterium]|nr:mechanosensitive ion channel family protein [Candidatus Nanopelagicales bacterium]